MAVKYLTKCQLGTNTHYAKSNAVASDQGPFSASALGQTEQGLS